jgi:hypothetical protein
MKFSDDFNNDKNSILNECCLGIENVINHLEIKHIEKVTNMPSKYLPNQNPYEFLGNFFKFIHSEYIGKYYQLIYGFINSINEKNYLIAALCGRSIIESTATLRYYNKECIKKITILSEKEMKGESIYDQKFIETIIEIINQHMHGSRFDWMKFFTTDKKTFAEKLIEEAKAKNKDYVESLPIARLLDSWNKDMPELRFYYDFFSDLVHPNLGSNLLLMDLNNNTASIGGNSEKLIGKNIAIQSVLLLTPCIKEATTQLANSVMLSALGNPLNPPTIH